ncbi:MAG: Gfo/Idh/MocA family oxidoreductase [Planctomycetes bacterium]|nr:Gfo/Idh/MocA family oxidoreductase [Planctomycetota bacterium]
MKIVNVGILGLGFMGKCHYETYQKIKGVNVAAICDIDPIKLSGDWSGIAGNIGGKGSAVDLSGISLYKHAAEMFSDPSLDIIDITLPTYLHEEYAILALSAGKHVICEKPLARDAETAKRIVTAAEKHERMLFTAHCIRFWPAYFWLANAVKNKEYGNLISAVFRRHSPLPTWSWNNWLQDQKKSGLCALDLHIHDADFILHCFGIPKSISSSGAGFNKDRLDHIHTVYEYDGALVTAEGAWEYAPSYPFSMTFTAVFDKATIALHPDGSFCLHSLDGECTDIEIPDNDGYFNELCEFTDCVRENKPSELITPEDACRSVRLIELEERSARTGEKVTIADL